MGAEIGENGAMPSIDLHPDLRDWLKSIRDRRLIELAKCEIRLRAYHLWLERGSPLGSPNVDWENAELALIAERELPRPDPYSLPVLRLQTLAYGGEPLSVATGFVVAHGEAHYLITNWHVVSGRHNDTNEILHSRGATPHSLLIWHHSALSIAGCGAWTMREESLFDNDLTPQWIEHPRRDIRDPENWAAMSVDIVALKLTQTDEVNLFPLKRRPAERVELAPGLPISAVGYPLGLTGADFFPIWKTGHLASDLDADTYQREFLVDLTGREGMSGAPVLYRDWRDDGTGVARPVTSFLGIYSGRPHPSSEIGIVWRASLLEELLATQC